MNEIDVYANDANTILEDYKNRILDPEFKSLAVEKQIEYYHRNYESFATAFPTVLRYMVQFNLYSEKALRKHIKRLRSNPFRSMEEYCERQADYVKFMYMYLNGVSESKAQPIWESVYKVFIDEYEALKKSETIVKENLEKNKAADSARRREELKSLLT